MADLTKYPNPLRLFTQRRDEWFTDLVQSFDIPMHIFSAVRDTQLGQLMFAIESVRMKRKRAGEDPGPGLLEGENATMFIPLFKLVKQLQDFVNHEDVELDADTIYSKMIADDLYSKLDDLHKQGQEWFTPLSQERLDELFLASTKIIDSGVIQPLMETLELSSADELKKKITEVDENLANTLFNIYSPDIAQAIEDGNFTDLEGEEDGREFDLGDDETTTLTFNQYHGRFNLLYFFILEFKRFLVDTENYDYDFDMIEPCLSLEMLVMFPQPDTSRLPLVKDHLNKLSKKSKYPAVFFDLIANSYQSFSRIDDANPRMVRKLFSTLEKTMKESARTFWKQVNAKLSRDDRSYEIFIAIMWSHLRAIQTQAQYKEQQSGHDGHSHSQTHAITARLEHIFWIAGRSYVDADPYESPIQFWSAFASIANKQVRSKEDSLDLFNELDDLLSTTNILTESDQQDKLIANQADQYSLIQRLLSYGLEARTDEVYDTVEEYVSILEELLKEIDPDQMHDSFDLEQEKKVVDDIRQHMKNAIKVDN